MFLKRIKQIFLGCTVIDQDQNYIESNPTDLLKTLQYGWNFLKFDQNQTESFFNYSFKVKSSFLGFDNGVEFSPMSSTKTDIQHRFLLFSRRNFEHFFTFLTINSWFHKLLVNISFALSLIYHIYWSVHCLRCKVCTFQMFSSWYLLL